MGITLPEQDAESWEAKTPGRKALDDMVYKMGSPRANRLCYLCLQHKLLERVHNSKRMWKNGKGFSRVIRK